MKAILSNQCIALTGILERGLGYSLQRRKSGFYSQRSKHSVPPDGHWRFIVLCAELAQNKLHIADIEVHWLELQTALYEAGHIIAGLQVSKNGREAVKTTYNAHDILNLKTLFSL